MTNDTILIRIDLTRVAEALNNRGLPETDREQLLDRIMAAYQRRLDEDAREFEQGRGAFEACVFDAL